MTQTQLERKPQSYKMLNSKDIMSILGIGENYAYRIIKQLNSELASAGYITIRGKVPAAKFDDRFYQTKREEGFAKQKLISTT